MGLSQSVATEIEIDASPDHVRSIFMDFPRYKDWCKWTIEPKEPTKTTSDLKPNDTLNVHLKNMAFKPQVKDITPTHFIWVGALWPIFIGKHTFTWSASKHTPGGTTMVQSEVFTGLLAFLMSTWFPFRRQTLENWDEFFVDLKREAEKTA